VQKVKLLKKYLTFYVKIRQDVTAGCNNYGKERGDAFRCCDLMK